MRKRRPHAAGDAVVFKTVDEEAIAAAIGATKAQAGIRRLDGPETRIVGERLRRHHARSQHGEIEKVALIDRQGGDGTLLHRVRLLGPLHFHRGGFGGNDHFGSHRAQAHLHRQGDHVADAYLDTFQHLGRKSRRLNPQPIDPGRHQRNGEFARRSHLRGPREAPFGVQQRDLRLRYHLRGSVDHRASHIASVAGGLGQRRCGEQQSRRGQFEKHQFTLRPSDSRLGICQ